MALGLFGKKRESNVPRSGQVPLGHRVYVIGDIHGCAELLEQLHGKIEEDLREKKPEKALIIYLGDYLDRGPASARVLDILTRTLSDGVSRIFLKGNHEEMLLKFLEDAEGGSAWCAFGGFETMMSYGIDVRSVRDDGGYESLSKEFARRLPPSHAHFLSSLQPSYSIGDYFFCHAGVRPGILLDAQMPHDLMWIREEFLHSPLNHGKLIVHGHSPVDEPEVKANRINIDTGAYATGRLTALVLDGSERRFLST